MFAVVLMTSAVIAVDEVVAAEQPKEQESKDLQASAGTLGLYGAGHGYGGYGLGGLYGTGYGGIL